MKVEHACRERACKQAETKVPEEKRNNKSSEPLKEGGGERFWRQIKGLALGGSGW